MDVQVGSSNVVPARQMEVEPGAQWHLCVTKNSKMYFQIRCPDLDSRWSAYCNVGEISETVLKIQYPKQQVSKHCSAVSLRELKQRLMVLGVDYKDRMYTPSDLLGLFCGSGSRDKGIVADSHPPPPLFPRPSGWCRWVGPVRTKKQKRGRWRSESDCPDWGRGSRPRNRDSQPDAREVTPQVDIPRPNSLVGESLGRAAPPPALGVRLDTPGQCRGSLPPCVWTPGARATPRE